MKIGTVIGIDPGESGGIAVIRGNTIRYGNMPETYPDIYTELKAIKETSPMPIICYLEDVGKGVPGQSSRATATFARHNGHLEMALYALGIPTVKVTPAKWMKSYSNQIGTSKGLTKTVWKNKLKGLAQQMYPNEEHVTLNTADAILLAHYGKSMNI